MKYSAYIRRRDVPLERRPVRIRNGPEEVVTRYEF